MNSNNFTATIYAVRLYLNIRVILYRHRIPFKYVADELFIFLLKIDIFYLTNKQMLDYILWKVENEFVNDIKADKVVERKKYIKALEDITK